MVVAVFFVAEDAPNIKGATAPPVPVPAAVVPKEKGALVAAACVGAGAGAAEPNIGFVAVVDALVAPNINGAGAEPGAGAAAFPNIKGAGVGAGAGVLAVEFDADPHMIGAGAGVEAADVDEPNIKGAGVEAGAGAGVETGAVVVAPNIMGAGVDAGASVNGLGASLATSPAGLLSPKPNNGALHPLLLLVFESTSSVEERFFLPCSGASSKSADRLSSLTNAAVAAVLPN